MAYPRSTTPIMARQPSSRTPTSRKMPRESITTPSNRGQPTVRTITRVLLYPAQVNRPLRRVCRPQGRANRPLHQVRQPLGRANRLLRQVCQPPGRASQLPRPVVQPAPTRVRAALRVGHLVTPPVAAVPPVLIQVATGALPAAPQAVRWVAVIKRHQQGKSVRRGVASVRNLLQARASQG